MPSLRNALQVEDREPMEVMAGAAQAIDRYRQWADVVQERAMALPTFQGVTRAVLVKALRGYYPTGALKETFLDELALMTVRRLLNGVPIDTTLLDEGPSALPQSPLPAVTDERSKVVAEVVEATAPQLVPGYIAAVRAHVLAPLNAVAEGAVLLARMGSAVDAWAPQVEAVFAAQGAGEAYQALSGIEDAGAGLLASLTLDALLSAEEGEHLGKILRKNLPYWLRLTSDQDKQHLEQLADRVRELQQTLAREGEGFESLEAFLTLHFATEAQREQGVFVDPAEVRIRSSYSTDHGDETAVCNLRDLLLAGPYPPDAGVRRTVVQVPDTLDTSIIDLPGLLHRFDLRARYFREVERFHARKDTRSLLFDLFDATLLHSAFAARLQGHLGLSGYEAVSAARAASSPPADHPSAVGLALPGSGPLALLLFHNPDPAAVTPFILYAPGKHDRQEWIELPSVRAVTQEIRGWVKEDEGRLYLLEQLPRASRKAAERYLDRVTDTPGRWPAVEDYRSGPTRYREALYGLVDQHVANRLETVARTVAPRWYVQQPLSVRQALNAMNEQLNRLQRVIQRANLNPETFVDFARRTVSAAIAPYLAERGVTEPVDPQTIVFEFQAGAVFDFSFGDPPGKQRVTLMDLAVTGYDDNSGLDNPRMPVHSSIGQDLSRVRAADLARYIRTAYLGDKYTAMVRAQCLNTASSDYARRRDLFARLAALTLRRDALVARLRRQLSAWQHEQLEAAIAAAARPGGAGPAVFHEARVSGQRLAQVYVLRLPGVPADQALLYTPQAPDGLAFRPYREAFASGLEAQMRLYYLQHVRLAAHDTVRKQLRHIARGEAVADEPSSGAPIPSLHDEYDAGIEDTLANVSRITKSRREVITEQVLKGVGFAAVPLGVVFPPLGFLLDATFIAIEAGRGIHAYRQGDVSAAVGFFTGASISLLFLLLPVGYHHVRLAQARRALYEAPPAIYRNAAGRRPIRAGRGLRSVADSLDIRQALGNRPGGLQQITEDGLTQGLYHQPASAGQPGGRYFIKQGRAYFEVSVDHSADTVRLTDARYRQAHYTSAVSRSPEGYWVLTPPGAVRGARAPVYAGALNDARELFPNRAAPRPTRVALAGEAVAGGYSPANRGSYLMGVEAHGSVVATLFNPATLKGAVLNIDHAIRRPIRQAVAKAVDALGLVDSARPLQATLLGGDWLVTSKDILRQVNHALGVDGILAAPEHWLIGNAVGGTKAVLLDLKTGATLVWRFTSQGREAFYDPLREYPAFGDKNLRERLQRFWERTKGGRWQGDEETGYFNQQLRLTGGAGRDAVAIPLHMADN